MNESKKAQEATDLITDYQLLFDIQKKLNEEQKNDIYHSKQLRKIKLCLTASNVPNGVALYDNFNENEKQHNLGITGSCHCHSVFCPVCAPYRMKKYKSLLAMAFKMFERENKVAIMVTFTVPNTNKLNFFQNFSVLKTCLNKFQTSGTWKLFKETVNLTDSFYAFDVTYGINGWHPHYHVIYWFDKKHLNEIADWELKLRYIWDKQFFKILHHQIKIKENSMSPYETTIQDIKPEDYSKEIQLKYNNTIQSLKKYITNEEQRCKKYNLSNNTAGFYISKTKDNKINVATNSNYFWSATSETTNSKFKKAHKGHFTVWQLLNAGLYENNDFLWDKWKEIITDSYGLQLYRLSRGLKQKILDWKEKHPEEYIETSKKKFVQKTFIIWLPKNEWYFFNKYFSSIVADISKLICLEFPLNDLKILLDKICNLYNIKHSITYNPYEGSLKIENKNAA